MKPGDKIQVTGYYKEPFVTELVDIDKARDRYYFHDREGFIRFTEKAFVSTEIKYPVGDE